jgi:sigma-B regulation protein RsbU (phosphoserine phosphatase)
MEPDRADVLISTPDPALRARLADLLSRGGWTCAELRGAGRPGGPEIAPGTALLVDIRGGLDALRQAAGGGCWAIAVGERGDPAQVIEAVRAGARDFLPADAGPEDVSEAIERAASEAEDAPGDAAIEVPAEPQPRRTIIFKRSLTLGRDPSCDMNFDNAAVSRQHARIARTGAGYQITDSGSRHGIFVNGRKVSRHQLEHGDEVRLGGEGAPTFRFVLLAPPDPAAVEQSSPVSGAGARPVIAADQEMRDIASLLDTFLTLNSDLLLDDLLAIVVSRSMELAGAERGMILLGEDGAARGGEPRPLRMATARRRDGTALPEGELEISRKIPESVMSTGKGVILQDLLVPEEALAHPSTIEIGVRSAMCVPLRGPRRSDGGQSPPLGVLYVDSTSATQPFSPRRLSALESLAAEASRAISNARLYQLSLEKHRMDEEMRIARTIQRSLLPPASYQAPWVSLHGTSEPSLQVGGDLLIWRAFGKDRLALGVGDVSGKGIPAAIVSSMLDGLCHGLASRASRAPDLSRLASEINAFLLSRPGTERFVSLFFGVLDESGLFSFVNAGHNPPLRVTAGGDVELLRAGGLVLGVLEDASYEAREIRLSPGDLLVLYSDGVTEARSQEHGLFGLDRLRDAALVSRRHSAPEVHNRILEEVAAFTRGALQADDITLMAVKYSGGAGG